MVMRECEKQTVKEPGTSFYTHFKASMKDRIAQTVFLSELIALRELKKDLFLWNQQLY